MRITLYMYLHLAFLSLLQMQNIKQHFQNTPSFVKR